MTLAHATVDQPIFKQGDAIDYVRCSARCSSVQCNKLEGAVTHMHTSHQLCSFFTIVRIGEVSVWQDTPAQHREAVGADRVLLHKLGPGSVLARRELFQATERVSTTDCPQHAVDFLFWSH